MTGGNNRSARKALLGTAGAGVLLVVCCAAPALIAAGALTGLGGLLSNPWLIAAGVVVLVVALAYTLLQRARGRAGCHVPPRDTGRTATVTDHDTPRRSSRAATE